MTVEITSNENPNVLRVFIVRHGQTDYNSKKILQGHLDIDINELGRSQATSVGKALAGIQFDDMISSDLTRCRNTVSEISRLQPRSEVRYTSNLRERFMGQAEGMYLKDALAQYGEGFREFGEKRDDFRTRVAAEWRRILADNQNSTNILLCSHGGLITMWANHLYREEKYGSHVSADKLKVPFNTSVTVIDVDKRSPADSVILAFGNTDHLGGHFEVKEQLLR